MTTGHGELDTGGLSAAGAARKAAILAELDGAMVRRNRRRAAVRVAGVVAPAIILAGVVSWISMLPNGSNVVVPGPALATRPRVEPRVEIVRTSSAPLRIVKRVDDAELQSLLSSAGKQNGLIRTGGRVILAEDLEAAPPPPPPPPHPESDQDGPEESGLTG